MLERLRIQRKTNAAVERAQAYDADGRCDLGSPGQTLPEPRRSVHCVTQIPVHIRALGTLSAVRNAAVGPCTPHNCPPTKYSWCFK